MPRRAPNGCFATPRTRQYANPAGLCRPVVRLSGPTVRPDSRLEEGRLELLVPPRRGHSSLASSVSWRAAAPVPRGPSCLDGPTFESAHPLACLSCRARRIGSARSVAEAHGYSELPVDCLAEPMCQTRAGESGSWFGIAPNEAKALATALAIRPPIGMIAPSPAPLTPSGLLGEREADRCQPASR